MPEQDINYLFNRYFDKTATPQEREAFMQWVAELESDEPLYPLLAEAYQRNQDELAFDGAARERILQHILGKDTIPLKAEPMKAGIFRHWFKYAAAILVLAMGIGGYFIKEAREKRNQFAQAAAPIVPGVNKAILTLADGKKIVLDKGSDMVLQDGNIKIRKDETGQLIYEVKGTSGNGNLFNTIETPRGGQYKVSLPDGSQVWLNAASRLRYPLNFANKSERRVELVGEAYFEVAKDRQKPFKVASQGQEVRVLGTHFNINAYSDENSIKTTLLEGSVRVTNTYLLDKSAVLLKPNEQAVLTRQRTAVAQVDAESAMMWKNGKFTFVDEPVESMMRKIARWYDIEVVYSQGMGDKQFTGTLSRYENIATLLKSIESTNTLHFKIEGRRVIVMD